MEEVAARRACTMQRIINHQSESSSFVLASSVMRWVKSRGTHGDLPPSPRFGHTSTTVAHGRFVVVFGGLSRASSSAARGALDDVVVLDVARDAWFRPQITGSRPPGRAFHGACVRGRGEREVLVTCGRDGRAQFGDAWTLDVETWTWRESTATTTPRDFACVVSTDCRGAIMFGGFDGKGWLGTVERLETGGTGEAWTRAEVEPAKVETLEAVTSVGSARGEPEGRSGAAMVAFGPNVLLFGGQGENGAAFSDAWCLKRERDGWRWVKLALRGHAPSARAGHAMSVIAVETPGGYAPNVVVAGGVGDDGWLVKERVYFDDAHVLDSDNARWRRLAFGDEGGTGPSARAYHTLTRVSESKCLCFGGFNGVDACNDAWWLVLDDVEYADISLEARAAPRRLIDALRDRLPSTRSVDVFEGNDVAFRDHVSACDVEDVRVGDVPKLMREYALATSALGLPGQRRENDDQGRFRHRDPTSMTLRDVGDALTELQGAFVADACR